MKNIFVTILLLTVMISCNNKNKQEGNLLIKGKVKGLRLGTLLIKKFENDTIKSIDSIKVDGNENFIFKTNIDEPEVLMLELPEIKDGKILFFAAPKDTIQIYTFLESFAIKPVIYGGENQKKWQEYKDMLQKFNDKEMDLFKAKFDASKNGQTKLADSLKTAYDKLLVKRQLYKLNFIFSNKNKPVSAYIGYTQFYDNTKALDTIYQVLDSSIKQSKYAREIKNLLKK